ncbi:MAG: CoA pyrophosphatase [Gemmatimonadales bacterium]
MSRVTFASLRATLARRTPDRADLTNRIEAAVAIVLAPGARDRLDVLFIRRAEVDGDPWSGQMAFPGGRREAQDRDLRETAMRETEEETAIVLTATQLLGELDDLASTNPALPPIVVRPFVFGLPTRPALTPSHEVAGYLWTPLEELPSSAREAEVAVRGERVKRPCFMVGTHVVWGMTHRILNQFIDFAL